MSFTLLVSNSGLGNLSSRGVLCVCIVLSGERSAKPKAAKGFGAPFQDLASQVRTFSLLSHSTAKPYALTMFDDRYCRGKEIANTLRKHIVMDLPTHTLKLLNLLVLIVRG